MHAWKDRSLLRIFGLVLVTVPLGLSVGCSSGGGNGNSDQDPDGGEDVGSGSGGGGSGGSGSGPTPPRVDVTPGSYAIAPPNQCKNQYYVEGCERGNPESTCGGECESINACRKEEAGRPGEPGFICPRFMQFSDEMEQAATDDAERYVWGADPFAYAVVGHDTDESPGSVDDAGKSPCCQCYQLVFDTPKEDQLLNQETRVSTITPPKPLIVQAFNTGATTKTFDIYMGAGGLGAFDACAPGGQGLVNQYSSYPSAGQPNGGGVKAVGEFGNNTACKNQYNLVTPETLNSSGCQSLITNTCNQIESSTPWITDVTRHSCIESNQADSLYHVNWNVLVKRVACPQALTEVTGCKLIENLPSPDPNVTTAAQAKTDPSFKSGYSTTTMQDCCKPTCAAQDHVAKRGHVTDGLYNSFYTCGIDGEPLTE